MSARPPTARRGLLLAALLASRLAAVDLDFLPPIVLPAGPLPDLFEVVDVTGDGMLDIAVSSGSDGRVRVLVNLGGRAFSQPKLTALGYAPNDWAFADYDGDGLMDLAASAQAEPAGIDILLGDGTGRFVLAGAIPLPSPGAQDIEAADLNGDGFADTLALNGDTLRVFLGDGAGGLQTTPALAGVSGLAQIHAVHADADEHVDVIVLQVGAGFDWSVLLGHGDGSFSEAPGPSEGPCLAFTWTSAAGDINGDSLADFLTTYNDICTPGLSTTILVGTSDGVSVTAEYPEDVIQLPANYKFLAIGDITGDGYGDLVGSQASGGILGVSLVSSNGASLASSAGILFTGYAPQRVAVGDFDQDGRVDIAFTNLMNNAVVLVFNATTPLPGWSDAGGGVAGSLGKPALEGSGQLSGGSMVRLTLEDALPLAPATLVIGFQKLNLPFKGGLLMPSTDVVVPGLLVSPGGGFELVGTWPSGLPAGFTSWMQAWIQDPAGPKGYAASNGVAAKVIGP